MQIGCQPGRFSPRSLLLLRRRPSPPPPAGGRIPPLANLCAHQYKRPQAIMQNDDDGGAAFIRSMPYLGADPWGSRLNCYIRTDLLRRFFVAKDRFWADWAATHTDFLILTIRTAVLEPASKIRKFRAVPCLLNTVRPQVYRPTLHLVVEAAGEHFHVRRDIG